jgi:hypothetical protein
MGFIEGFQHQALAIGALLAAVPLVIHLLNRQRHKPMPWAGMRFVLAAYKKTRRRSQLENLLLLLLRMAAIALLAFALSRPFTSSDSPLATLTEQRRDVVLVLDVSGSTGYRENVDTVFERIIDRGREHLLELDAQRGDKVRLMVAAGTPRLLSWRSPEDALSLLPTLLEPAPESLDLYAALEEIAGYALEDAAGAGRSELEVRILTDVQRRNFSAEAADDTATEAAAGEGAGDDVRTPPVAERLLARPLDKLAELGVRVLVEDLGSALTTPPNLGVVDIHPIGTLLGPGLQSEIGVVVRNHGASLRAGVRLALFVDGQRQPSRQIEVPARGDVEQVFSVVFTGSGHHAVEAVLEGDGLAIDDSRVEVLFVPPPTRVLIVNGDPHPEIDKDEVGFLRAVLDPLDESGFETRFAPFDPTVIASELIGAPETDFSEHDVVFLANLESVSERVADALETFVSAGGALVISVGDRVVPESYNARLWRSDGSGLLPAELLRRVEVRNRREAYFRAATIDGDHPALAFFADDRWRPLFTEVPIYAFLSSTPLETTKVLARLDDDAQSPLLLERDYDRGRVFLWTTSIDPGWTRLPESPKSLIPFVHELLRYAGRPQPAARNLAVGVPVALETEHFPRSLSLVRPDGSSRALEGEAVELGRGRWRLPPIPAPDEVGLWRIATDEESIPFAVQFDVDEGDLDRMAPAELSALHPALVPLTPSGSDERSGDAELARTGELWRGFARICLIALVLESLWAGFIGRRRRLPA